MKQSNDQSDLLASLMKAAQTGDSHAYARLLTDITPRLRRFVRSQRRALKAEDVEDLIQDILLSLHAVRASYDPERPFLPWLLAIARNRLADGSRRYARQAAHEVQVEFLPVTFSDERANVVLDEYRDPDALRQAIRQLPPGQREAIELLKLREMSLREAAAASGTTVGALKVAVHRAMGTLRSVLGKES